MYTNFNVMTMSLGSFLSNPGIDGSYGDVVGLQGPGQVYLQDCYPSPQYYHPLQGKRVRG